MKKLRCFYLGILALFIFGLICPDYVAFAKDNGSFNGNFENSFETNAENVEDDEDSEDSNNTTDRDLLLRELSSDNDAEDSEELPKGVKDNIMIRSFNPGFSNEGEFVELLKLSENDVSLAGLTVSYTTSSGKEYVVYEFRDGSEMVGESLLMRLASSSEVQEVEDYHDVADLTYTRNMSQSKGKITLIYQDEVIDKLCWGLEEDDCFSGFKSNKPTTLVRDLMAEEVEDSFQHIEGYAPSYNKEEPGLKITETPEEIVEPKCRSIEFSEVFTYFESTNEEQFIELFNRSEEKVELSRCFLRYKNKNYALSGEISANGFRVFYNVKEWGLSLTKNPTSSNTLEIIDADGEVVDKLTYSSGQRKGVSLSMLGFLSGGAENWVQTYRLTPGEENIYQQFKTCPIGKVINLETGNCVNETSLATTVAACPEGKYRNPLTGRCKSYAATASAELKPCAEGYERNPATGRCRKIVNNDGADYELVPETFEEKTEFVAIWAIIIVIVLGLIYIIFQYREEIKELVKRK